jgi:hypothetical protein
VQLDAGFLSRLKREFAQSVQRVAEEFQALISAICVYIRAHCRPVN